MLSDPEPRSSAPASAPSEAPLPVLLRGTLQWPSPVEEGGRIHLREPLRDTLIPLAVVGGADFLCCLGVAFNVPLLRIVCLLMAALLSFLVAALVVALFRRAGIEIDGIGRCVRFRGGAHGDLTLPVERIASVGRRVVSDGAGTTARAAGLLLTDGSWMALQVDWREGEPGSADSRSVAEAVARVLGLPLESPAVGP